MRPNKFQPRVKPKRFKQSIGKRQTGLVEPHWQLRKLLFTAHLGWKKTFAVGWIGEATPVSCRTDTSRVAGCFVNVVQFQLRWTAMSAKYMVYSGKSIAGRQIFVMLFGAYTVFGTFPRACALRLACPSGAMCEMGWPADDVVCRVHYNSAK